MADLTTLEEKLAEVTGLAGPRRRRRRKSSRCSTTTSSLADAAARCARRPRRPKAAAPSVAEQRDGKKTAILEKARETKSEATEMMRTYLGEDSDELDGFEFLTMAEAGEVGHWAILGKLNEKAGEDEDQRAGRVGAADPGAAPDRRPRRLPGARGRGGPQLLMAAPASRARVATTALLSFRVAYGLALIAAPAKVAGGRWLGPGARAGAAEVPLRGLGAREVALHGLALATLWGGGRVRPLLGASIAGDLTDIAATTAARAELPAGSAVATAAVAGGSALLTAAAAVALET